MNEESVTTLAGSLSGQDVMIVGSGPSLCDVDISRLSRSTIPTVALNRMCGEFEATFAISSVINSHVYNAIQCAITSEKTTFVVNRNTKQRFSLCQAGRVFEYYGMFDWKDVWHDDYRHGRFCVSKTVAFGAIDLCRLMGAKSVILLGCDCRRLNGQHYFNPRWVPTGKCQRDSVFIGEAIETVPVYAAAIDVYRKLRETIWTDITILNASTISAVDCFDRVSLLDVLDTYAPLDK